MTTLDDLESVLTYPTLNPSFVPVQKDSNTIHIRAGPWSGPVLTIQDVDEDNAVATLIEEIDGDTHVRDVVAAFDDDQREEVLQALEALHAKNIIYDSGDSADPLQPHLPLKR